MMDYKPQLFKHDGLFREIFDLMNGLFVGEGFRSVRARSRRGQLDLFGDNIETGETYYLKDVAGIALTKKSLEYVMACFFLNEPVFREQAKALKMARVRAVSDIMNDAYSRMQSKYTLHRRMMGVGDLYLVFDRRTPREETTLIVEAMHAEEAAVKATQHILSSTSVTVPVDSLVSILLTGIKRI